MGFCAVYRPPRTPYGKTYLLQKYGTCENPWRKTYQKISQLPVRKSDVFDGNVFFLTFLDFLENILFQSKSQAFIRTIKDAIYR